MKWSFFIHREGENEKGLASSTRETAGHLSKTGKLFWKKFLLGLRALTNDQIYQERGHFFHLKVEELIALAFSAIVMVINIAVYRNDFASRDILGLMFRYFSFGAPFYGIFFLFVYVIYFWKFYLRIASLVSARIVRREPFPKGTTKELLLYGANSLRVIAPLAIITLPFYTLLENFSYALRFSANDPLFFQIDKTLFGTIPILWLQQTFSAPFFIHLFRYAYFSLPAAMSISLALFFLISPSRIFRKALLSFVISLVIAYPLFYAFPCQDPNHYFLENLRGNALSPEVKETFNSHALSPDIVDFITKIGKAETNENNDNTVPVSCFPSMHATWAFLVLYFFAVIRRYSLFFTIPWTLLLLTGGVYFAQHYVIDYIVAIPVAIASIWLSYFLLRVEKHYQKKSSLAKQKK